MLNNDLYNDEMEDMVSLEGVFIPYDQYFRRFGVRRIGHLSAPILTDMSKIVLPRNAVLLYQPMDDADIGLSQNHILVRDSQRLIFVEHVTDLATKDGFVRKTFIQPSKLTREYLRTNRKTRLLNNIERVARDDKILIVENFAFLNHLWQYKSHPLSVYYKWKNIQNTIWTKSNVMCSTVERNQYMMVNLPDVLPTFSDLKKAELNINRMTLQPFTTNESLNILDIWCWLGANRDKSSIHFVEHKHFHKLHLVFILNGVWSVINLGLLNDWRKEVEADGEQDDGASGTIDATTLQKRFLRYLITIFEHKTSGENTIDPVVAAATDVEEKETVGDNDVTASIKTELTKTPIETKTKVDKQIEVNKKIEKTSLTKDPVVEKEVDEELVAIDNLFKEPEIGTAATIQNPLEQGIMTKADELAVDGFISTAQYKKIKTLSNKYKELPNPFGEGTLETLATISPADVKLPDPIKLPDDPSILDKSMLNVIIEDMDNKYNKTLLEKDIAATVLSFQKAGVIVLKYEVEQIETALNKYNSYTIKVQPVNGSPSVIRFKLPIIDEDSSYLNNGIKCKLRKQRVDVPIRKVKDNKVSLTSYYSKLFVTRSSKVVNNFDKWLFNQINLITQTDKSKIKNIIYSNKWNNYFVTPRIYSILAKRIGQITINNKVFHFDYAKRNEIFGEAAVKQYETDGNVVVGLNGKNIIVVNKDDEFIEYNGTEELTLGNIMEMLEIDESKSPVEVAELGVSNKSIPVGIVLSYYLGFNKVLTLSNVKYKKASSAERLKLLSDEFTIKFLDETYIFSKRDKTASLLFGGFIKYKDFIKRYGSSVFNRKDIYANMFDSAGMTLRYLRELNLLNEMWVDPITEGILKEMNEPIEFIGLLLRSVELLLTDWSPDETDMHYQRIRGYERFSGFVYKEMVTALKQFNVQSAGVNASIQIHPEAVWREIDKDVSKYLVQESNPIHNLKEKETVTFAGTGGRSANTMTKSSRAYHKNDLGTISEASPDSKTVGAITYLTPNPNFNSLRGTVNPIELKDIQNSSLLSTSALLAPCSDTDDPKRINFINIQNSAGISAIGYKVSPIRTGYEKVISHRVSDLYAYTAKKDGKVISVDKDHITIEYADGEKKTIEVGRRFGISEGTVVPHQLVTKLKVGDTFVYGDTIAYNENYFEPDFFNPKRLNLKQGVIAKTVIMETVDTLEDSSAISEKLARLMSTKISKVRNIVVKFDQVIRNLVKVGSHVDLTSILCTIEDSITASGSLFDDDSISALKAFAANTPKAKYSGVIEKIEVFYNGDKEDMSESLREVANTSDKVMKRQSMVKGKDNAITGSVDSNMRIDAMPLELDSMVIKVYITADIPAGVGDKGSFGNQMKTIFGRVMSGDNKTESGEDIDAVFGFQSISNRIVNSPFGIGTTNTLLKVISKRAAEIYRKG